MTEQLTTFSNHGRRRFLRDLVFATSITCASPALLAACQTPRPKSSVAASGDTMDEALEMMAGLAQLSNHGPMAAEALIALGRPSSVIPFVETYKKRFTSPYPRSNELITHQDWRTAIGDGGRVADWTNFFTNELKESEWPQVLDKWVSILAPGLAAAAGHGLIRTGHAVRSLAGKQTSRRLRELAEGLGYWAAYYQILPEAPNSKTPKFKPADAIRRIPVLPEKDRPSNGSIMIGLRNINDFSPFAEAADLINTESNATRLLSEVTEAFAINYINNVTQRNLITLIHTITGMTALRSLLPYLSVDTTLKALRYGWQFVSGLYAISSLGSTNQILPKKVNRDDLIERALMLQEEHAIKFTEACLGEYALNPKPVYLLAADDALRRIRTP